MIIIIIFFIDCIVTLTLNITHTQQTLTKENINKNQKN